MKSFRLSYVLVIVAVALAWNFLSYFAGDVFFSDPALNEWSPVSPTTVEDGWLYRWQTLIAGSLAFIGALLTVIILRLQIKQDRKLYEESGKARFRAALATSAFLFNRVLSANENNAIFWFAIIGEIKNDGGRRIVTSEIASEIGYKYGSKNDVECEIERRCSALRESDQVAAFFINMENFNIRFEKISESEVSRFYDICVDADPYCVWLIERLIFINEMGSLGIPDEYSTLEKVSFAERNLAWTAVGVAISEILLMAARGQSDILNQKFLEERVQTIIRFYGPFRAIDFLNFEEKNEISRRAFAFAREKEN